MKKVLLAAIFLILACCACLGVQPVSETVPVSASPSATPAGLPLLLEQPGLTIYGQEQDWQAAQDIASAMEEEGPPIRQALDLAEDFPVRVDIFPDQAAFDRGSMNPEMAGAYAISGSGRIQIVSPRNPIAAVELPYQERVRIAVHEYTHLALNQVNPDLPDWLTEGAAVSLGPHAIYTAVCHGHFPFQQVPTLDQLLESYEEVPAADLFSFTLVEFIAAEYGMERLLALLYEPDSLESELRASRAALEQSWRAYMQDNYQ